jgi:hypothetical protein
MSRLCMPCAYSDSSSEDRNGAGARACAGRAGVPDAMEAAEIWWGKVIDKSMDDHFYLSTMVPSLYRLYIS